jgi:diguanylate cyclase (GGDEF)-like protein
MNRTVMESVLNSPRLPTLPAVAIQLLELTADENVDLKAIAEIVRYDQALAAKVLRTVNSSFYGLTKPCATIRQALVYLGLNTVKSLVLGFSLVETMDGGGDNSVDFDFVTYWRRSLYSAVAAREISARVRCEDPEEAFLAAIMQDFGMVVMHRVFGDEYLQCIDLAPRHRDLCAFEETHFELTHPDVGAELARRWNLPDRLVDAIRWQHALTEKDPPGDAFVRQIILANLIAEALELEPPTDSINAYLAAAHEWFGLDDSDACEILSSITASVQELSRLFNVKTGAAVDVAALLAQAEQSLVEHQLQLERERQSLQVSNQDLLGKTLNDPLTGAANRACFDLEFARLFSDARRDGSSLSVIFCDADRFKSINDSIGHQAGDAVLVALAERLAAVVGDLGIVCRYGGEEFAILLPGLDRAAATRLAETLRMEIEAMHICADSTSVPAITMSITVSLGVASMEPATQQLISRPELLLRVADQAVYAAKKAGRNCVRVFRPRGAA